jgi:hypothetical protein
MRRCRQPDRKWYQRRAAKICLLLTAVFAAYSCGRVVAAQQATETDPVIRKAQDRMDRFVVELGTLRCDEHIVQQKLKTNDKVEYGQETVYDSLVMIRFEEGKIRVFEQHVEQKMPHHPIAKPLVTTHGFSTLAIIFHPYYTQSFRFSRAGDDVIGGRSLVRIHFEYIPGTPSPAIYQKFVGDQPLAYSGTAWIDPDNGAIHRIDADIGSSLKEMGLKDLRAQLTFGEVTLDAETEPRWLPISATVDLETPRQHWRNIHRFTDYRSYRVQSKVEGVIEP